VEEQKMINLKIIH